MPPATEENLGLAKSYVDRRSRNDTRGVLELVSDDIVLEGPISNVRGKEAFGKYLDKNRAKGTWGEPYLKEDADHVAIDGSAKIAFVTLRLVTRFYFTPAGKEPKICRIVIAKTGVGMAG